MQFERAFGSFEALPRHLERVLIPAEIAEHLRMHEGGTVVRRFDFGGPRVHLGGELDVAEIAARRRYRGR